MRVVLAVDEVWARYRTDGDLESRNALVEHYLSLVDRVATRLRPTLPRHVDHDDLISYGTLGLIDAVTRFDPSTGARFEVFAWPRIRGEMVDELRRFDPVQRSLRSKARRVEVARSALAAQGRRPNDSEVADEMGVSLEDYQRVTSALVPTYSVASIDVLVSAPDGSSAPLRDMLPDAGDDVVDQYEIDELRHVLAAAWNALPDRERTVLWLRYVEGLTLTDAANLLGVALSRVSQLLTDAVRDLRSNMAVL